MPAQKIHPVFHFGEESSRDNLAAEADFVDVTPNSEKFVTLDFESSSDYRSIASRRSRTARAIRPQKTLFNAAADNNLHVRSSMCVCSTFASGAEGKPDQATEDLFAQIKYRHFLGAFFQTSCMMPLGALGQAVWALLEEHWVRAGILTGVVAPMYLVYAVLTRRYEKWYLRMSGTMSEKTLIAMLCLQSLAIVAAEFMRPQLDYGMLVMHIGFVHNFSPLGEMGIHLVTAGFGLVPYVLLKVHRVLQFHEDVATASTLLGTTLVHETSTSCLQDSPEATQLLEILMPTVILLYQSVVTMRRFRSMRLDLLIGCILNRQRTQLKNERTKCEGLLTSMLPKQIIGALKANEPIEPTQFNDVTVLFIQICDFDTLCTHFLSQPEAIVEILNTLYLEFDRLSDVLDVYKVETVCDVYMAVVGCPQPIVNNADLAAHFAMAVQESMKHLRARLATIELEAPLESTDSTSPRSLSRCRMSLREFAESGNLHVRIGLNSGKVRAGVVGLECPRYKLVGDTVNTASRMESTCSPGRIQLSASTREKLTPGIFLLEDRGEIQVKGKGVMNTSYLNGYVDGLGLRDRRILIEHGTCTLGDEDEGDFGNVNSEKSVSGPIAPMVVSASIRAPAQEGRWREEFKRYGVLNLSEMDSVLTAHHHPHYPDDSRRFSCGSCEKISMLFLLLPPSEKHPAWIRTLRFDKAEFMEETLEKRIAGARSLTIIWLIILAAVSTIDIALEVVEDDLAGYRLAIMLRAVGNNIIGLVYLLLITNQELFRRYAQTLTLTMLASQGVALLGCGHIIYNSDPAIIVLYGAYVLFYKVITIRQRLTLCVVAVFAYVVLMAFSCQNDASVPQEMGRNIAFLLMFFIFMACGVRLEEHLEHVAHYEQRKTSLRLKEIDNARAASLGLLESLLPSHVVDLVAEGVSPIAEFFSSVTVMFTDIKGFTALSAQMMPQELVDLLNAMYSAFDEIIVSWALYKVEIIGDAYFVSAGCPPLPGSEGVMVDEWAMRAVEVGLALQRALSRVTEDDTLSMRVGLHTGSVVAGVVGKKGPRYHLFGAAVGYAEKMESSGIPGRVHISDATHELLVNGGHEYDFQERSIEGEGESEPHKTWLVNRSKNRQALRMQKEMIMQRRKSGLAGALSTKVSPTSP